MVQHTIAGVGFTAFVVTTAIVGLSSPSGQGVAVAERVLATPGASADPAAVSAADLAAAAARAELKQAAQRSAERARLAKTAAKLASRRAKALTRHGKSVAAEEARLKAAKARAAAERARARAEALKEAAERARAEAEAAEARRKAMANRGYLPGTTDPRDIARQILQNKYGYGAGQFGCFDNIISRESRWNMHATNPSSGAYGLAQALPGSKMASIASDWRTNPATQIIWGVQYMDNRYGSPCEAWGFWQAHNWY
jgi:Transglycosylase SLT domain